MKLIISQSIYKHDLSKEQKKLLKKFSVKFEDNEGEIIIIPQKVTLDELDMNHLVSEFFLNENIRYAWIGGEGCEFALLMEEPS